MSSSVSWASLSFSSSQHTIHTQNPVWKCSVTTQVYKNGLRLVILVSSDLKCFCQWVFRRMSMSLHGDFLLSGEFLKRTGKKLLLCTIKYHVMQIGASGCVAHWLLTLTLDGGKWSPEPLNHSARCRWVVMHIPEPLILSTRWRWVVVCIPDWVT